jgi:prevent-host-death family protein
MTGIREFARNVSRYLERVETTGRPLVLTRHGRPVAAVIAVDAGSLEDLILAHAPDFAASLRDADRELAAGETRPLAETLAELETEDALARAKSRRKPTARS